VMTRVVLLALVCWGLGGCAPLIVAPAMMATAGLTAVQAGTTAYVGGVLESAEKGTLAQAYLDALDAVEELRFELVRTTLDEHYALVMAREAGGRRIRIQLQRKSPIVTKVRIRVGFLGDQAMSRLVLAQIRQELGDDFQHELEIDPLQQGPLGPGVNAR
jgi:hypothetical protein